MRLELGNPSAVLERVGPLLRRIDPLLRWRYAVLSVAAGGFGLQHIRGTGKDWKLFVEGSELLFGQHHLTSLPPGGLHLYANYPELQIGPVSFLAATPFRVLIAGGGSRIAASLVMTALAPAFIYLLERTARAVRPPANAWTESLAALTTLFGGLIVVEAWATLACQYAHLDDVLVLGFACLALWAVARRRPVWLGVALGLAVAAKPWGVVAFPLVLALPSRERWKALLLGGGISAVVWLPFVLADTATMSALRPQLYTAKASVLHLFGVQRNESPEWIRPVQLGASLLVGALAVWRGRWPAVLLGGIAVRLLLDPGVFLYYSAGLLLVALAWDLMRSSYPLPLWTLASFWFLDVVTTPVSNPTALAVLRLVTTVALVGAILLPSPAAGVGPTPSCPS